MQIQKLGLRDTIRPPSTAGKEPEGAAQAQPSHGVVPTAKAVEPKDKDLAGRGSGTSTRAPHADSPVVALPFVPGTATVQGPPVIKPTGSGTNLVANVQVPEPNSSPESSVQQEVSPAAMVSSCIHGSFVLSSRSVVAA